MEKSNTRKIGAGKFPIEQLADQLPEVFGAAAPAVNPVEGKMGSARLDCRQSSAGAAQPVAAADARKRRRE